MADFRRWILALAGLALLLGSVPLANAQATAAFQCVANAAVPPTIRSEGLTELVGDIVLNCNGGTPTPLTSPATAIPQANISVFLNTQITSRLISGGTGNSEATLLIDEPPAGSVNPCTTIPSCTELGTNGNANQFKTGASHNAWQGTVSGNGVSFIGVPVDPPGSAFTRVYRITNIRANAAGLGTPGALPIQVVALISATPATSPTSGLTSSFPINNPQQIVGFSSVSLQTGVLPPGSSDITKAGTAKISVQQCIKASRRIATLDFRELFPTAFKPRTVAGYITGGNTSPAPALQNTPGIIWNSETGYYNDSANAASAGSWLATAGLADFGTRLRAVFNNVPAGVSLYVSVHNTNMLEPSSGAPDTTGRVATLTGSDTAPFGAVAAGTDFAGAVQLSVVNNSTSAVWEVLAGNPLSADDYLFDVFVNTPANPGSNSPAVGTGSVNLSYAPTYTSAVGGVASSTLPIPRFVDTSTANNFISIIICRTNLLFPFVTNQAGFDTGLAISNTSTDPFGTAPQQGPCTLNFYGANAPAAITTTSIASGTTYTALASTSAPNFQGYVIAVCNFQFAHGFAFVSDLGARNLAMGYLALIIPDPPRSPDPLGTYATGTGENLGM